VSQFTAIQSALYTALTTDAAVDTLLARARSLGGEVLEAPAVYDHVPQPDYSDDSWFPYVTIGEIASDEWDTDTETGFDSDITIHVWSRELGRVETKEIQGSIYDALHRHELDVAGVHTITLEHTGSFTDVDPDGKTRHGVSSFRLLTDQT